MTKDDGEAGTLNDAGQTLSTVADKAQEEAKSTAESVKSAFCGKGEQWRDQAGAFAEQASASARQAAGMVKEKTGVALHGLSKIIADSAETVDARLGPAYGDYARQAADSVSRAARALDEKDVDQLAADARDYVRSNPVLTVGAAALAGFFLMRLVRGGSKES